MSADLTRHAVDVLPEEGLAAKLKLGRPLRVKLGIDPTSPDIHLGFAYVLDRLREFQDAGHVVVLIVGDYTARIGDPSGRSKERPVLPDEVLDKNAKEFAAQAFQVLDREKTEIRFNGEWLGALTYAETVRLARTMTVARLLERDDFANRFGSHVPISLSELLYPLMQAYDSVAIEADIEIGGTDQRFNLLAGRDVMPQYGLEPQVVITFPLLVGLDGEQKMSKSRNNYVGIKDPPEEMFRKIMRLPDEAIPQWWEMLVGGASHSDEARDWKLQLATHVAARWHGEAEALRGRSYWLDVVAGGHAPEEEVRVVEVPSGSVHLPKLLSSTFGNSTSYWRRLILQGAIRINGEVVHEFDVDAAWLEGKILKAGRTSWLRATVVG
jgi:tyrosyl-tRNA synthetase